MNSYTPEADSEEVSPPELQSKAPSASSQTSSQNKQQSESHPDTQPSSEPDEQSNVGSQSQTDEPQSPPPNTNVNKGGGKLSAWVVYWDQDTAANELDVISGNLEAVCHFSAVFDANGHLSIPDMTASFHHSAQSAQSGAFHYLTIVNDVVYPDKPSSQKDTDILKPLLASAESRAAHISELLDITEHNGYDGLEIDYETLHRVRGQAENFALFCAELWKAAQNRNLHLRVVLEPTFPANTVPLPPGPEYVVMFYNLYGYHSGSGPKADSSFIGETAQAMQGIPGDVIYAFATGGFDWAANGSIQALNEVQAWSLLSSVNAEAHRDKDSGCVYYTYKDKDGMNHSVWFADGKTIKFWMDTARQYGENRRFALWRTGGNVLSSLEFLNQ